MMAFLNTFLKFLLKKYFDHGQTSRCWNEKTFTPHLCGLTWNTWRLLGQLTEERTLVLEKIQQRATKIVPSLKNLCYADRLAKLNLTSL